MQTIELADGRSVPFEAVRILDLLELRWPGATLREARPAIVAAVIDALDLREEYAVVGRGNDDVAEGCDDADEAITSMEMYSMDAWMAGRRWVSDWRNIEST